MATVDEKRIIGLVDAGGAAGVGDESWSLIFRLEAWRHPGGEVVQEGRDCELPESEERVEELMDLVRPYSVVELEVGDGSTDAYFRLRRVADLHASDPDLERIARELRAPIVVQDPTLGRLEFDRGSGSFAGRAGWCGRDVEVVLSCSDPADPSAVLAAAKRLFDEQGPWDRRVQEYAVEHLLPLKNESWLDEGEAELSPEGFRVRMSLESISVEESGGFTFWHDDGDLFLGHMIQVGGDLDGLKYADIPG